MIKKLRSTLTSVKLWNVSVLSKFVKERKEWKHQLPVITEQIGITTV